MNIDDPAGKEISVLGEKWKIIGVVKDFHLETFYNEVKPLVFMLNTQNTRKLMIKIAKGSESEALENLQQFYQTNNPGYPFEYHFLEDKYEMQYPTEHRVASLSKYFMGIAILISCLGLFGLVAYSAERRVKEIGIRKILGSSVFGIVRMLSGSFTKMVVLAIIIALPMSYIIVKKWLDDFAYRIDLEWWFFAGSGIIALLIAWTAVGWQTVKAARQNPVDNLRYE